MSGRLGGLSIRYSVALGLGIGLAVVAVSVPFLVAGSSTSASTLVGIDAGGEQSGPANGAEAAPTFPELASASPTIGPSSSALTTPGQSAVSGNEPSAPTSTTSSASGRDPDEITDQGVGPDTILIGVLYPDEAKYTDANEVFGSPETQWGAYIDDVNARGGIAGRKVAAVYYAFDPLNNADKRSGCLDMTEDKKVFAVFNVSIYTNEAILCVTQEHQTPFLAFNQGVPDEWFAESGGRLFTIDASWTRSLRLHAIELHRQGLLQNATLGLVDVDHRAGTLAIENGLLPTLESLGITLAHRATVSANVDAAPSQIALAIREMRDNDVDTVFLAVPIFQASQFVQQAEGQLWFPQYLASDFLGGATDSLTLFMTSSFDGALATTGQRTGEQHAGYPEPAIDAGCREVFERATGEQLERGGTVYVNTMGACALMQRFEVAMRAVGSELTRDAFAAALRDTGRFAAPFYGGASFTAAKQHGSDLVRTVQWHWNCRCWIPRDDFHDPT